MTKFRAMVYLKFMSAWTLIELSFQMLLFNSVDQIVVQLIL